jgi:MFS transporter, DHA3 family, macrolide efflux protein
VVVIVVVWAAAGELYRSTSYAVLPDIVKVNELSNANGVTQSAYQVVNSLSTVLGGGLIVIAGVVLTFVYGVAGYGLAALFSGFLVYRFRIARLGKTSESQKRRNMVKEIVEGFHWLITKRGLFELSLLALVFNFVFGIPTYFLVIYVTTALKAGAFLYRTILAIFAGGGGAGSLLAGRITSALAFAGKVPIIVWGGLGGALLFLLGIFPSTMIALIAVLGIGLGLGFGNNVWLTSAQNLVPNEMRGRYFAIDGLLSFVGGPPSIAVGGILITTIGITRVFEISGASLLIAALGFALMKDLWELDGRSQAR